MVRRPATHHNDRRKSHAHANDIDVAHVLPKIRVPTLVLHARHDNVVPLEQGRLLAASIPNARLVTLESDNHVLLEGEPAWTKFLQEVEGFLGA